ncbi:MAG: hypothetical protein GY853_09760 [PVC group bacterium]|nr:hypothetical protein [PVC group bacterium]
MINENLYEFKKGLENAKKYKNKKYLKPVLKNLREVQAEIDIFEETMKQSEKYTAFENKRNDLIRKYAVKDENGNPKSKTQKVNGQEMAFFDIEDTNCFNEEINILQEEYKIDIEEREIQVNNYNEELKEEVEINIIKIDDDLVPDDIDGETYEILLKYMIIEEE